MRLDQSESNLDALGEEGVALMPEEPEDMWHANNLIHPDDILKARAIRNVVEEMETGSIIQRRVHTFLTIQVKSTFFDPAASSLRVSGTVITENDWVSKGQYHTLDLDLNRRFTLWKKYGWDSVSLQILRESLQRDKQGAVAAVVMHEGIANICLITDFQTLLKQRVQSTIPKKRSDAAEQSSGMRRFYEKTLGTMLRAIDFKEPRVLLLASPGFVAQDFKKYIASEGERKADKLLQRIARDVVTVHSSSGHLHSLNEVLKSPEVGVLLKDKKFSNETRFMDQFFERIRKDDGRAWYGAKPVERAVNDGAVGVGGGVLLVNNSLFRSQDIMTRKRFVALVEKVKEDGGEARVLSSDHESGQRLDGLGGIAALLTYPMVDLDEEEEDEEGVDDAGGGDKGGVSII